MFMQKMYNKSLITLTFDCLILGVEIHCYSRKSGQRYTITGKSRIEKK